VRAEVIQVFWQSFLQNAESIRNVTFAFVALVGLYIAWTRARAANRQADAALRQAELSRRDHVADLFNKAVEQLVSDKLELRLGAIFTLRQIAGDFPDLAVPTFQLLSAYLRQHAKDYGDDQPPADVAEIMETLKGRLVRQ
jgi:hypothetical protein